MPGFTDRLIRYFTERPGRWIDGLVLAPVGGVYAYRTRISEARIILQREGLGTIENKQVRQPNGSKRSLYRFIYAPEGKR